MTLLFVLALLVLTVLFCIFNSFYIGSMLPTVCYAVSVCALAAGFGLYEKKRRKRLVEEIYRALEEQEYSVINESESAPLTRQLQIKRQEEKIRDKRVTESYRHLSSLLSDIAHQCKTPLTAVTMYTELLPVSAEAAAIREQVEKLKFLLEALVKLSRCEGGLIEENIHPVENTLEDLLLVALPGVVPAATEKSITFVTEVPENLSAVFDLRWTAEAVGNILDNGVKYAPAGSKITISACRYDMFVRLDIMDEGPGIPEEEMPEIWKRFYRGKKNGSVAGVGIGLTLCRMILQAQHGRILCTSKSGEGACFSVFLPVSGQILQN